MADRHLKCITLIALRSIGIVRNFQGAGMLVGLQQSFAGQSMQETFVVICALSHIGFIGHEGLLMKLLADYSRFSHTPLQEIGDPYAFCVRFLRGWPARIVCRGRIEFNESDGSIHQAIGWPHGRDFGEAFYQ